MEPPAEPDLTHPWDSNIWLYGLRTPFSLIFIGWITFAQVLSPKFNLLLYGYVLLAAFFGLIVGAHYIDIARSAQKFTPYFRVPKNNLLAIGIVSVAIGVLIGIYIALDWHVPLFLLFVLVEGAAAILYPMNLKYAHSYLIFGLSWGAIPFLGAYYVQADALNATAIAISAFVGVSVVMMHHLAIMTRESSDWKNAVYLLNLYRYSVYLLAVVSLVGRLLTS